VLSSSATASEEKLPPATTRGGAKFTTSIASVKLVQCVLTLDQEDVKSELPRFGSVAELCSIIFMLCCDAKVKAEKAKKTKSVKETEKADQDFI
jgi:hypothetical protein